MENWRSEYQKNLDTMRANREKVPLEMLVTKYAKPWHELLSHIGDFTKKSVTSMVLEHFSFGNDPEEVRKVIWKMQEIISDESKSGTFTEAFRIACRSYSAEAVQTYLEEKLGPRLIFEAYGPYWVKHCRSENGTILCDLMPGWHWKAEWGLWTDEKEASVSLQYPPTLELLREEEHAWKSVSESDTGRN